MGSSIREQMRQRKLKEAQEREKEKVYPYEEPSARDLAKKRELERREKNKGSK